MNKQCPFCSNELEELKGIQDCFTCNLCDSEYSQSRIKENLNFYNYTTGNYTVSVYKTQNRVKSRISSPEKLSKLATFDSEINIKNKSLKEIDNLIKKYLIFA